MKKMKPIELAKKIIDFCVNHNECKLLNESETGFTIRNRQRDVTYFTGTYYEKRFEVKRIQHFQDGKPVSLFIWSVGEALDGKSGDNLVTKTKLIIDHKLRKPEDANEIIQTLLNEKMEWSPESIDEWREIYDSMIF